MIIQNFEVIENFYNFERFEIFYDFEDFEDLYDFEAFERYCDFESIEGIEKHVKIFFTQELKYQPIAAWEANKRQKIDKKVVEIFGCFIYYP